MNDLEYLNQIAAQNRPEKAKGEGLAGFLRSKIVKIVLGAVAAIVFIAIIGSMLGSIGNKERDLLVRINTRTKGISASITSYNTFVKSSRLREMGVSLSGILSETSKDLYAALTKDYGYSEEDKNEAIEAEEKLHEEEMKAVLADAKLNGILDRGYLHQLIYEVALLTSLESEANARTNNEAVRVILTKSMASLNLLYEQLSNYSDSTN